MDKDCVILGRIDIFILSTSQRNIEVDVIGIKVGLPVDEVILIIL